MKNHHPRRYHKREHQDLAFERVAARAVAGLPRCVRRRLENVAIIVEEEPSPEQLAESGLETGDSLYGLYEGVPLGEDPGPFSLPARIALFRLPLIGDFGRGEALRKEIRRTIIHEVAHHFGLSEEEIERLGYE